MTNAGQPTEIHDWRMDETIERNGIYLFQHFYAKRYGEGKTILNVGCKEDPAKIGEIAGDVVQIDTSEADICTGTDMTALRGYIHADFLEWQPDKKYDVVVLGELLEHCDDQRVDEMLAKCFDTLQNEGYLVVTCPQDNRKKEEQYGRKEEYYMHREGITSWHQNYITKDYLDNALKRAGFVTELYDTQEWMPDKGIYWHMCVCRKANSIDAGMARVRKITEEAICEGD